jgi:hypothetical protein
LTHGRDQLTIDEFSLEQSFRDVCGAIALEAKKRGHEISLSVEESLPADSGIRPGSSRF